MPIAHDEKGGFWVVWNPERRPPMYRHMNEEDAIREAERLARMSPGETFIVLQTVCARRVNDMQRIDMRVDPGLPF